MFSSAITPQPLAVTSHGLCVSSATRSSVEALIISQGPELGLISLGAPTTLCDILWKVICQRANTYKGVILLTGQCYNMRSTADTGLE